MPGVVPGPIESAIAAFVLLAVVFVGGVVIVEMDEQVRTSACEDIAGENYEPTGDYTNGSGYFVVCESPDRPTTVVNATAYFEQMKNSIAPKYASTEWP